MLLSPLKMRYNSCTLWWKAAHPIRSWLLCTVPPRWHHKPCDPLDAELFSLIQTANDFTGGGLAFRVEMRYEVLWTKI